LFQAEFNISNPNTVLMQTGFNNSGPIKVLVSD